MITDTGAVRANAEHIIASLPEGTKLIPVLKDDAYGLGIVPMAKALCSLSEVEMVAAAHFSEGAALRHAGIDRDILIMGNLISFQIQDAVGLGLTITAGRPGIASAVSDAAEKLGVRAKIHIKIDTGLHRIGFEPGPELDGLISEIKASDNLLVTGAFSHFGNLADRERTEGQYAAFLGAVDQLEKAGIDIPLRHISDSEATEYYPRYSLDAVRVGRRLYMDHPEKPLGGIKEVSSWRTYITNIKIRRRGDDIGYGGKIKLARDCTVATIGIGYGDGFLSSWADGGASVLVAGKLCPVIACCMDQSFIDVSGAVCGVDDEVTVFGSDGHGGFLSIQNVAAKIGANEGCGITSGLSSRVARLYI